MSNNRLTELDGLRGIAAMAVVLYHYFYTYNNFTGHSFDVPEFMRAGAYGVQMFFMISGFVIFWTISRSEKGLDFAWSRFSRLYPVYWVALITTFTVVTIFSLPGREVRVQDFIANFVMFHEYLGYRSHVDGVYWTLTIELAFYLWVLLIFVADKIRHMDKILTAWIITSIALTYGDGVGLSRGAEKLLLLEHIELFAAGVCFYKYKTHVYDRWTHIVFALSTLSVTFSYSLKGTLLLFTFYAAFWLIIIGRASLLRNRVIVYFGTISYSLYLIHQNIGYVIINKFYAYNLNPMYGIAVATVLSIIMAHLMVKFVEKPSLHYLRNVYHENSLLIWVRGKV